ncbi:hypothetical protein [Streptomyces sparsogenes]|nr:hypothetical protein [Streptomyces sparsogenes]
MSTTSILCRRLVEALDAADAVDGDGECEAGTVVEDGPFGSEVEFECGVFDDEAVGVIEGDDVADYIGAEDLPDPLLSHRRPLAY